jgi:polar amino acid transport system substrate-binding protein
MINILNKYKLELQLTIVMAVATFFGYILTNDSLVASLLYPASGFYLAYYFIHGKKSIIPIFIGLFSVNVILNLIYTDTSFLIITFLALSYILGNFIEAIIFKYLMIKTKNRGYLQFKVDYLIGFILIVFVSVLIGGFVSVTPYHLLNGFDGYWVFYLRWIFGAMSGVYMFGTLILYGHYNDNPIKYTAKKVWLSVIYIGVFALVLAFLSGLITGRESYQGLGYIFILFYVVSAYYFSFRMLLINSLLLIMFFNITIYDSASVRIFSPVITKSIFHIMTLNVVAILIKVIDLKRQANSKELKDATKTMEHLILSTNSMFESVQSSLVNPEYYSKEYFKAIFAIACKIYPKFDMASCFLKENDKVIFVDALGYDIEFLNSIHFDINEFYWSLTKPIIVKDHMQNTGIKQEHEKDDYFKAYPYIKESVRFTVFFGNSLVGGMSFDITENNHQTFDENDMNRFTSYQKLINSYYAVGYTFSKNMLFQSQLAVRLTELIELTIQDSIGHGARVAKLATKIGETMRLDRDTIETLYHAGLVHDVGKSGVDAKILQKPGPLSIKEYEIVKDHPLFGYRILSKSETLIPLAKIVRNHHENWDGTGYPDRLLKNEIPYLAQIIHICDAVATMNHDQVYRKALALDDIISELRKASGTQFNPQLVEIMVQFVKDTKLKI